MKAVLFEAFGGPLQVTEVPDPAPPPHGVVVEVGASGICRSDWHGWMGHDPAVRVPHVPGHELAGTIRAVGRDVARWRVGDRVTVPFVAGCGACGECRSGNPQVCERQYQPGFTGWGSFAQYVALHFADLNLVALPDAMDFATAASLGCRFATAFRAVVDQGRTQAGEWVAVHGCGGVGLSAVMIAAALGARVVAVDVAGDRLRLARSFGAEAMVDAAAAGDVVAAVVEATGGGAHVSLDALGDPVTCWNSVANLRRRGRHVQVGLITAERGAAAIPMAKVIAHELELRGSHGMQAARYDVMLAMIGDGRLAPERLIAREVDLAEAARLLPGLDRSATPGIAVITDFS